MIDETPPEARPASDSAGADADADARVAKAETPEEQMARFEDALKEEDWGHQPC